mmetsp:Transcript_78613/g.138590  ORF Transcript_78613/g.138590 Transcript_78613/m.138590 type:complete len:90 (+) Transcript_78613:891-1160(+)
MGILGLMAREVPDSTGARGLATLAICPLLPRGDKTAACCAMLLVDGELKGGGIGCRGERGLFGVAEPVTASDFVSRRRLGVSLGRATLL